MYLNRIKPYTAMSLLTSQQKQKLFQEVQELRRKREEEKRIRLQVERENKRKQINEHQRLQKLIAEDNKAKAEKDALRAFKCSLLSFRIYQTNLIERGFVEDELYTTRKELQDAEDRGEGKLNWAAFDNLVESTKILFKL